MIPRLKSKFLLYLLPVLLVPAVACAEHAATGGDTLKPDSDLLASGRYCGIYCLYAVLRIYNIDVNCSELIDPNYIGSQKGSSVAELRKAAEDFGIVAKPMEKMGAFELKNLKLPAVLHVKSQNSRRGEYSHYELFLGMQSGRARLYNPPERIRLVTVRYIMSRWDGVALLLSPKPISLFSVFTKSIMRALCIFLLVTITVIACLKLSPKMNVTTRINMISQSVRTCCGIVLSALVCTFLFHFFCGYGLLAEPAEVSGIMKEYAGTFIPKIKIRKLATLLGSDTVIIDARLAEHYESGHIEGAINIPADSSCEEIAEAVTHIPRDVRIVVYSQSAGCRFAEKVAVRLLEDGFSNVSIFKGGWRQWQTKNTE